MFTTVESRRITANRILKALPLEEYERLSADLEPVSMPLGEILCNPDEPITHVYFPDHGTVSLVSNFEDGTSVEVGMVGNEGMFGVCVFLGSISTPLLAQVQLPGEGLRMRADVLQSESKRAGSYRTSCFDTRRPSSRKSRRLRLVTERIRSRAGCPSGC